MIQFDDHIFQMGWFNHQPVIYLVTLLVPLPNPLILRNIANEDIFLLGGGQIGQIASYFLRLPEFYKVKRQLHESQSFI